MHAKCLSRVLACVLALTLCAPAYAKQPKAKPPPAPELQHCPKTIGTLVVSDPKNDWWSGKNLEAPSALVKVLVRQSGCFDLIDRGIGMELADQERARAAKGNLKRGNNLGQGQVKAADYILVPEVATVNENAGGSGVGGLLGALVGTQSPTLGAVLGGFSTSKKTATVTLTLVSVRDSTAQSFSGTSNKKDVRWGAGGGVGGTTGIGAVGVGGYTNTEGGELIANAYMLAYMDAVRSLGGLPADAAQAAAPRALAMTRQGRLYAEPATSGKALGMLEAGTLLYPTGNKSGDGNWLEVKDELDHQGWVSSYSVQPAK